MNQTTIQIDPEFEQYIPSLLPEELKQLEENILKDGAILNPLILWNGILVDGHNRYRIAQKHPEISYTTIEREFPDRYAALAWICRNQLGRRNLNSNQRKYLIGRQYMAEQMCHGGARRGSNSLMESSCQNDNLKSTAKTCDRIAKEHGVSARTVLRASDFAKAVDLGEEVAPGFREQVLSRAITPADQDMTAIVQAKPEERPALVQLAKAPRPRKQSAEKALMQKIADDMLETRGTRKASDMLFELEDAADSMLFRWEMCLNQYEIHRKDPENIPQIDALLEKVLDFLNQVKTENQKITAL